MAHDDTFGQLVQDPAQPALLLCQSLQKKLPRQLGADAIRDLRRELEILLREEMRAGAAPTTRAPCTPEGVLSGARHAERRRIRRSMLRRSGELAKSASLRSSMGE